jgi:penicillin amidase
MRVLRIVLLALLALIGIALAIGLYLFQDITRGPLPVHDGTLQVSGLDAEVEILRDEYGVPNIYASTTHDLFFAQGFTQAQDRWWQMEFSRAIGDGRIQELTGANDEIMGNDLFIRTMGWRRTAERNVEAYSDETRANMQAFADGVNAYIGGKSGGDLAFEYSLLGVTGVSIPVRDWTMADSDVWLRVMQWDLGNGLEDRDRTRAMSELGADVYALLEPVYPFDVHPTIVDPADLPITEASLVAVPAATSIISAAGADTAFAGNQTSDVAFAFGQGDGIGSNNWVVSGSRTASGTPLMANDPHLGIQMPSIWYEIGLHCQPVTDACPYDVRGYSLPAIPGVVLGHNAHIAWGFTNVGPDVIDLFSIKVNPDNPLQYEYDGEMLDMTIHTEEIKFGDGGSTTIQVRETILGPIINDNSLDDDGVLSGFSDEPLAIRWSALDTLNTVDALFALDRATDWESFRAAAALFHAPAQNMVYADIEGNIGYQTPGLIPIRPAANNGLVIQDGSTSETAWLGYIPSDLLPRIYNPDRGWIHSANEALVPLEYYDQLKAALAPEYGEDINVVISTAWDYGFRGARIVELLDGNDQHTIESLQAIQNDNKILIAEAMAPTLAALQIDDATIASGRDLLVNWDFQADADSAAAALFSALWKRIPDAVFNDQYGETLGMGGGSITQWSVIQLLDQPDAEVWDDVTTDAVEDRDALLVRLLTEAHAELVDSLGADMSKWQWGSLHSADFVSNPLGLSGISIVEDMVNRSAPTSGWTGVVNATNWSTQSDSYAVTSMPSFRSVYDLGDLDNSVNVNTTGQSGHPFADHYADLIPLWTTGQYKPMYFSRASVEANQSSRLLLQPR